MAQAKQDMGSGSVKKLMLQLMIPAVVAQVVNLLYNIVDRIYIGHIAGIGAAALTGVGLFTPILMLLNAFAMLVGAGGAPRTAIALGQGDKEQAEKIISNSFTMLLLFSVVLTIGFYGRGDFFTLKSICETVARYARIRTDYVRQSENPSYHPGRCAELYTHEGVYLGILGQIHPVVAANYSMTQPVYVAEIDVPALFANRGAEPQYKPLPKFPATTRDFSFVCAEGLEVGAIEKVMYKSGVKLLEDVKLLDIYRGVQVGEGRKSVTFRIVLRSADHTLTVDEADKAAKKILDAMERELGITIRQ